MPTMGASFALEHVVPYIAGRLDRLTPHFVRRLDRRVALHEHPGVAGVTEGVLQILRAIPGLEVVDLEQPRVGYMCNSLAPVAAYKRELHARELAAATAAGVDSLVGVYHACHRELCAHETTLPFRIVNFLELVGEAMGVERPDLFKQWKMMQDVDRVLADLGERPETRGSRPRDRARSDGRPHPRRATAPARPVLLGVAPPPPAAPARTRPNPPRDSQARPKMRINARLRVLVWYQGGRWLPQKR